MTAGELQLFLGILPQYMKHLKENPHSIIAKIFGVFTVKLGWGNELHLMLMENTIFLEKPKNVKYIFDLKGSRINRTVKGTNLKPSTTLKDMNLLEKKRGEKNLTLLKKK